MPRPIAFIPGRRFPGISITGAHCALGCDYCRARYLHGMEHAVTPKQLYDTIRRLVKQGARGVLVSGGFTRDGRLPIEPFLPAIRMAKRDFDIVVSVHAGLVDKRLATLLRNAGVDIVDYEVVLDPAVIRGVKHLARDPEDFIRGYEILLDHGPPYIAPHVPIGFNYGRVVGERSAVDAIASYKPYIIIFLVFIPTPGTPMENVSPPGVREVVDIIEYARSRLGGSTIYSMGCMRPFRLKQELDKALIEAGVVDRIVNPPRSLIASYSLKVVEACCSIPRELLYRFID